MRSVWWKCSLGHSWKAKVAERTIEEKGCKVCEKDYLTVFPKLAVMYYAAMKHIKVQTDTDKITELIIEHGLISFHSFNQIQESIYFFL